MHRSQIQEPQRSSICTPTNFDSWVVDKTAEVNVGGNDVVETSYNRQGDIETITRNGVSTLNQRWLFPGVVGQGEIYSKSTNSSGSTSYSTYYRGQPSFIRNPMYRFKRIETNSDGTTKSETAFGDTSKTVYSYDSLRRLKAVDPARSAASTRSFLWTSNHRQRTAVGLGATHFDEFGRTDHDWIWGGLSSNRSATVDYRYNGEGTMIYESYPQPRTINEALNDSGTLGRGRHYKYDGLGRITRIQMSSRGNGFNNIQFSYGISNAGNLTVTRTDGRGSKTVTEYFSYGVADYNWPVVVTEADGVRASIQRDNVGRVLSHTRSNVSTYYQYNDKKLLSQIEQSVDGITRFEYDNYGKLITRRNNGKTISYSYYDDARIKQEEFDGPSGHNVSREYQYDNYGTLEKLIVTSDDGSQNNELSYLYDPWGNLLTERLSIDGLSFQLAYGYDELSNRNSIQYPNGNRYLLDPDTFGDPLEIKQQGASQKVIYDQIEYNANGSASVLSRRSHEIENTIDAGLRPEKFRLNGTNRLLASKDYSYDAENNVSQISDFANDQYYVFDYDSRNRLTSERRSGSSGNWSFSYLPTDDLKLIRHGNIDTEFVYDDNTRRLRKVVQDGTDRDFTYDNYGNIVEHERIQNSGSKSTLGLRFNAANQLYSMSDGTKLAYDGRGLRVKKDLLGPIYSLYDTQERLIYKFDRATGVTSEYFYVSDKLVARRDTGDSGPSDGGGSVNPLTPTSAPTVPGTISPDGAGYSPEVTYTWEAVSGAQNYFIDIRKVDSDTVLKFVKFSPAEVGCEDEVSNCEYVKYSSSITGANRWRIRAENQYGNSGWSDWKNFDVGSGQ